MALCTTWPSLGRGYLERFRETTNMSPENGNTVLILLHQLNLAIWRPYRKLARPSSSKDSERV